MGNEQWSSVSGPWRGGSWWGAGAERQARARPGKALCARLGLKCCHLGNKESQMFEKKCHATQCVCQHEGTGEAENPGYHKIIQTTADKSLDRGEENEDPQRHCLDVGMSISILKSE